VAIGQKLKGFVRALRPDGKIDLSLDQAGYRRVAPLAERIVQTLQRSGGRLGLGDDSSPALNQEASPESGRPEYGSAVEAPLGLLPGTRRGKRPLRSGF
jgi:hypothetical protein